MNNKMMVRGGAGDITKADVNARPQDNLYLAVNSKWLENIEIPSDRSRISSFDGIDLNIEKELMNDFADFADRKKEIPNVPNLKKAVELYKLARDFDKRNADGAKPIQADLKTLTSFNSLADLNEQAGELFRNFAVPFTLDVDADMKNTKVNVLQFDRPNLILPDTTTYKSPDAKKLLDIYKKQTVKLLTMAGIGEEDAEKYAQML